MPPLLIILIGFIIIATAIWGLFSGKIIAGSKGFSPNYYYKDESPILYYGFIVVYILIGSFILYNFT